MTDREALIEAACAIEYAETWGEKGAYEDRFWRDEQRRNMERCLSALEAAGAVITIPSKQHG
jgi:hypothetical protein